MIVGCDAARFLREAAALGYVDLHQLAVMNGELDDAIAEPPERLGDNAQVFGQVGNRKRLKSIGTHVDVSGWTRRSAAAASYSQPI
jgi:hypothetical protein